MVLVSPGWIDPCIIVLNPLELVLEGFDFVHFLGDPVVMADDVAGYGWRRLEEVKEVKEVGR